jgi:hypothetical protein
MIVDMIQPSQMRPSDFLTKCRQRRPDRAAARIPLAFIIHQSDAPVHHNGSRRRHRSPAAHAAGGPSLWKNSLNIRRFILAPVGALPSSVAPDTPTTSNPA